jgi:hypothetical protein
LNTWKVLHSVRLLPYSQTLCLAVMLLMSKYSSLLKTLINYKLKSFITLGPGLIFQYVYHLSLCIQAKWKIRLFSSFWRKRNRQFEKHYFETFNVMTHFSRSSRFLSFFAFSSISQSVSSLNVDIRWFGR